MITYSPFQQQYPLSAKKLWKKIVIDVVGAAIFSSITLATGALLSFLFSHGPIYHQAAATIFNIAGTIVVIRIVWLIPKVLYLRAYIKRYYYDCNENFITIKKGVFGPTEIHVQYAKIQDVYVDQDILDRMMGLYDVHIASATVTSGIEAHIDGVDRQTADGIKGLLLEKVGTGSTPPAGKLQPPSRSEAKFDHPVSSAEYPIQDRWLVSAAIASLLFSLFMMIFLPLFLLPIPRLGTASLYLFIYLALSAASFLWQWAWKNSYYFEFTPEYVLLRDGVISKEERHLPYRSIQNVTLRQGILDRILGIGGVSIENAAGQGYVPGGRSATAALMRNGILIPGQSIEKANELLAVLNDIMSKNANPAGMGL